MRNSIVAHTALGGNVGGTVVDEGFNLSSDASAGFTALGSRNAINPGLDAFDTAGGIVAILTLSSNSPAINAITVAGGNGSPGFDQRNAFRLEPYDIGAYEFEGTFSRPQLQAMRQGTAVAITWPAWGDFTLQSTTDVSLTNSWTTVTNAPSTSSGMQNLVVQPGGKALFFRLGKAAGQ
jgi:hypothetical protein